MPENTQHTSNEDNIPQSEDESSFFHTCACGETHLHRPGSPSHRESCTSPKKFGNTCCCHSEADVKDQNRRCGHGPRCH